MNTTIEMPFDRAYAMQGNCAIELKLDECLARLIAHAKALPVSASTSATRLSLHGSSVPAPKVLSWLNLPALPAFTASVRSHSDGIASPDTALPLSSYAHDDALLEVAKRGSKGAQIVTQPLEGVESEFGGNDAEPGQGGMLPNIECAKGMATHGSPQWQWRKYARSAVQDTRKYASPNERGASLMVDCSVHTNGASSTHWGSSIPVQRGLGVVRTPGIAVGTTASMVGLDGSDSIETEDVRAHGCSNADIVS